MVATEGVEYQQKNKKQKTNDKKRTTKTNVHVYKYAFILLKFGAFDFFFYILFYFFFFHLKPPLPHVTIVNKLCDFIEFLICLLLSYSVCVRVFSLTHIHEHI